jgi:quercetin dioxygenase-like cupin family protein
LNAIVRNCQDQPWEQYPVAQQARQGRVAWKDLIGASPADGANMLVGVARLRPGETLELHRHSEPETYFTLAGRGLVSVEGEFIEATQGTTIYIPGGALHGMENRHDEDFLILYVFAVDDWAKVVYRF